MASLLERMDIQPAGRASGPVRNRGNRSSSVPYNRALRNQSHGKADSDSVWQHDMYNGPGGTLGSRLTDPSTSAPRKVDTTAAETALKKALLASRGGGDLSIKGAGSAAANVVEVAGLVQGTTAADVEAIFKRCGVVVKSNQHGGTQPDGGVIVRLTFKNPSDAQVAVSKFNGQSADGRILRVSVVGSANVSLRGRLEGAFVSNGTVDELMNEDIDNSGGSKMRSDDILKVDPRAQVLIVPPGVNPAEYEQRPGTRGRGGRGGRRGRGRRDGGMRSRMDVD